MNIIFLILGVPSPIYLLYKLGNQRYRKYIASTKSPQIIMDELRSGDYTYPMLSLAMKVSIGDGGDFRIGSEERYLEIYENINQLENIYVPIKYKHSIIEKLKEVANCKVQCSEIAESLLHHIINHNDHVDKVHKVLKFTRAKLKDHIPYLMSNLICEKDDIQKYTSELQRYIDKK